MVPIKTFIGFLLLSILQASSTSADSLATCGYSETTYTYPLVYGNMEELAGQVEIVVKENNVIVTYSLSKEDCTLTDAAHVEVVNSPIDRIKPGQFSCQNSVLDSPTSFKVQCPSTQFTNINCCDDLIVYTHIVMQCGGPGGSSETLFGGPDNNECESNQNRWCRYSKLSPPCSSCGCDKENNQCLAAPSPCPECLEDKASVCPGESCVGKVQCEDCPKESPVCPADLHTCATPEACPECQEDQASFCPGEPCVSKVQCEECPKESPVCPADLHTCATPSVCPQCSSVIASVCPGENCKTPQICPDCFEPTEDCLGCQPQQGVNDECDPCKSVPLPDGSSISGNKFCEELGMLTDNFKCCPPTSNCKKTIIPTRSGLDQDDRSVTFICSTNCGSCDGKTAEACSLFGSLVLNNDGIDEQDDVFETCPEIKKTVL